MTKSTALAQAVLLACILAVESASEQWGDLRLVGGTSSSNGRVEIYWRGRWGTVCDDMFFHDEAIVVCRELGFQTADVRVYGRARFGFGTGPILLDNVECRGDEDRLIFCNHDSWGAHNCGHYEDVGVDCDPDLNVIESSHPYHGHSHTPAHTHMIGHTSHEPGHYQTIEPSHAWTQHDHSSDYYGA